jgi:hypothetical protein
MTIPAKHGDRDNERREPCQAPCKLSLANLVINRTRPVVGDKCPHPAIEIDRAVEHP